LPDWRKAEPSVLWLGPNASFVPAISSQRHDFSASRTMKMSRTFNPVDFGFSF